MNTPNEYQTQQDTLRALLPDEPNGPPLGQGRYIVEWFLGFGFVGVPGLCNGITISPREALDPAAAAKTRRHVLAPSHPHKAGWCIFCGELHDAQT